MVSTPSAFIQKSCSLWVGKAAVGMLQTGWAPCESFPVVTQPSQVGPSELLGKYILYSHI